MTKDDGRRSRVYDVTAAGRKELSDVEVRWTAVTDAVRRVLKHA